MTRVGVIPDTHFPAEHPAALAFILDTFNAWQVEQVVHIGDVTDLHNPSFHDNHPDMPGPRDEFEQALSKIQHWDRALHEAGFVSADNPMLVCEGNHDDRPKRVAAKFGVTSAFLAPHAEVWQTPHWVWGMSHEIDGVVYMHGHKGCGGGQHPAHNTLKRGFDKSLVIGHYHSKAGINPMFGLSRRTWGMDVGCLVDRLHPAMKYAEGGATKPAMSCGVVINGHPYYEMMACGPGEKYHRSKF